MSQQPIIQIRDLSVRFGEVQAVNHVTFDIPEGKITAIVGESGSGKTTIATAILDLIPDSAKVTGKILYKGQDVRTMSKHELRNYRWSDVSMVFQAAQSALNPVMTVGDQFVETVKEHNDVPTSDIMKKASQLLDYVRLDPERVLKSFPHELSGGMKQRVMIAFSLLLDSKFVILDEPTTALDVITQDYIFDILARINRDFGTTMLLVTHDIAIVARAADYIGVMYGGKLVEFGETFRMFEEPRHPYTQGLIQATPSLLTDNDSIKQIGGLPPNLAALPSGCAFHPRCPFAKDICRSETPVIEYFDDGELVSCHRQNNEQYKAG